MNSRCQGRKLQPSQIGDSTTGWSGYHQACRMDASFLTDGFSDGCNFHTLPRSLYHAVCQASFRGDIADVACNSLTLPMSKAMNSRCQGRKSGTVTQKCIFNTPERLARCAHIRAKWHSQAQATPPRHKREKRDLALVHEVEQTRERFHAFRRLVLCSLLGNYRHCRVRLQNPKSRQALYQVATSEAWVQSLLHQASDLVQWCVRDYIVAVLEDSPALHASVATHMHFDEFRELTQQAMGQVRTYLDQQLAWDWSHASRCFTTLRAEGSKFTYCTCLTDTHQPCAYDDHVWLQDLVVPLRLLFHDRFLSIQYYKPHTDVVGWLVSQSIRAAFPLHVRPDAPPPPPLPTPPQSDDDEEDEDDHMDLVLNGNALQHLQRAFARQEKRKQQQKKKDRPLVGTMWATVDARMYLSHDDFLQLRQVVDASPTLEAVVRCLPALTHHHRDEWLHLLHSHRDATGSKADRVGALKRLYHLDAHVYNLVQVAAELIKERHPLDGVDGRCLGYLSAEIQAQQIRAARSKLIDALCSLQVARIAAMNKKQHELEDKHLLEPLIQEARAVMAEVEKRIPTNVVDQRSTCLVFCRICGLVYSNVRVTHRELAEAAVTTRKYYRYGLASARHNYTTGETFCRQRLVTHRGGCGDAPLTSVSLLGRRYAFNGRQYQLCCGCGDIMSPDPQHGAQGGMMCTVCTDKIQERTKAAKEQRQQAFLATLERTCASCGHPTTGPTCTFLFPFGLVCCKRCAHPSRVARIKARQWSSQAELREFMGELHTSHRTRKRKGQVRRGLRAKKANKQKDRAKKA